jgi:hypothetical protein
MLVGLGGGRAQAEQPGPREGTAEFHIDRSGQVKRDPTGVHGTFSLERKGRACITLVSPDGEEQAAEECVNAEPSIAYGYAKSPARGALRIRLVVSREDFKEVNVNPPDLRPGFDLAALLKRIDARERRLALARLHHFLEKFKGLKEEDKDKNGRTLSVQLATLPPSDDAQRQSILTRVNDAIALVQKANGAADEHLLLGASWRAAINQILPDMQAAVTGGNLLELQRQLQSVRPHPDFDLEQQEALQCQEWLTAKRAHEGPKQAKLFHFTTLEVPLAPVENTRTLAFGSLEARFKDVDPDVHLWLEGVPAGARLTTEWSDRKSAFRPFTETLILFLSRLAGAPAPAEQLFTFCNLDGELNDPFLPLASQTYVVVFPPARPDQLSTDSQATVRVCNGATCVREGEKKNVVGQAVVKTQPGWGLTLHGQIGATWSPRALESWAWRTDGPSGGSSQLFELRRETNWTRLATTSVLLSVMTPCQAGDWRLGLAGGPSILVGTKPRVLGQWTAGLLFGPPSWKFFLGAGVRSIDVPDFDEEGARVAVERRDLASTPEAPRLSTSVAWTHQFSVGLAVDLGTVADGAGKALFGAQGGGK